MADLDPILVELWGERVGALSWDAERQLASFEYDADFIANGLNVSPLNVPLRRGVFSFPDLARSNTFRGLPGFIADSLPEKFGNRLLDAYLAKHGKRLNDLTPLERLCYVGTRGMGALEYQPDQEQGKLKAAIPLVVSDLMQVAQQVLQQSETVNANMEDGIESLITVGTSAGGAKAKAVIAINDANDVISGQADVPAGYEHWLLKFDEMDNEEHASSRQIGRIEYAYSEMANDAGINMMDTRLLTDRNQAHFMTRRFDRVDGNDKVHVVTFAGMVHADRDPPGQIGYERLFQTIRDLGLAQSELNEMYRRMVFNIVTRNQDDHTKNHAFLMFGDGSWQLSPAYDLCFSYKPGNPFIEQHQMSCNGKRDGFELEDLIEASKAADIKKPMDIIDEVKQVTAQWPTYAEASGIDAEHADSIFKLFRKF